MTSYTQIFGGSTIYPSEVSYLALALDADVTMSWPIEADAGVNIVARIMDVTPDAATWSVIMPPASETSVGQTALFNNVGVHSFTVRDNALGQIAVVAPGEQWQIYLTDNTTDAGSWVSLQFGATTATVQPSALAGFGLTAIGTSIAEAIPVVTFNTSPLTVTAAQRASMLVWTSTGTGSVSLPSGATVGSNFFVSFRNNGGGDLVITPAGIETINSLSDLTLVPGDSVTIATDGLNWYTLGLGQSATFAFDYTTIAVTGGTYTLTGAELNRISYRFTGVLASNQTIIVPATTQQYWVTNATTGSYTLGIKTAAQVTAVDIPQGASAIVYCDGSNVVLASAATSATPSVVTVPYGGTGITSYTTGDMIYASGSTTLTKLAAVAANNVLKSGGVGTAPLWGKVVLSTDVTGAGVNASGVNATVPAVYIQPVESATNVDIVITPKGVGAILGIVPDGLGAFTGGEGGNKRGTRAVDFSLSRLYADQVASGSLSTVSGGQSNKASGASSSISGGQNNTASALASSVMGGSNNTASGINSSAVGGTQNTASGLGSIAGGATNTASASYSMSIGGGSNTADGQFSSISGGTTATTRGVYGAEARANGRFSVTGDAQRGSYVLRRQTTTASPTEMGTDGNNPSTNNIVIVPEDATFFFEATIVARCGSTNETATWVMNGTMTRATGGSVVAAQWDTTNKYADAGASTWAVQRQPLSTGFTIMVTGEAGKTINWVAHVRTVEVVA